MNVCRSKCLIDVFFVLSQGFEKCLYNVTKFSRIDLTCNSNFTRVALQKDVCVIIFRILTSKFVSLAIIDTQRVYFIRNLVIHGSTWGANSVTDEGT